MQENLHFLKEIEVPRYNICFILKKLKNTKDNYNILKNINKKLIFISMQAFDIFKYNILIRLNSIRNTKNFKKYLG